MLPEPLEYSAKLPWESSCRITPAGDDCPGMSVVIPIHNAGQFLERTLRSLLCNDLDGVELIVMDGGSNDNTPTILEYYSKFFKICTSEPDKGQSDAINRGFEKATQPVLYWLNGDDILLPDVLTKVRNRFSLSDQPQVVVGDAYMTELDLKPINRFRFSNRKLKFKYLLDYAENHLVQPSVFFTRRAWDSCGPVNEDLHYAMDADLFLSMSSRFELVHLPLDIAYSVYHEDCKTRGKRAESVSELALVQARHGGFEESSRTLGILVDMFNELAKSKACDNLIDSSEDNGCPNCKMSRKKVKVMEERLSRKLRVLLNNDLISS